MNNKKENQLLISPLLGIVLIFLLFLASRISTNYVYGISHFLKWNIPLFYFDLSMQALPDLMAMAATVGTIAYLYFVSKKAPLPSLHRVIIGVMTILFFIPGVAAFILNYPLNNSLLPIYKNHTSSSSKVMLDIRNDEEGFLTAEYKDGILLPCYSFEKFESTSTGGLGSEVKLKPYKGSLSAIKCEK